MSLIYRGKHYLLHALCIVFASQLITVEGYAQEGAHHTLTSVAEVEHVLPNPESIQSLLETVDKCDRDKYESLLFKISSELYRSYIDLEINQQNTLINMYVSNDLGSSIDKLIVLSDSQ